MDKFETAPPLQASDIDKIVEHMENKGYETEYDIILPKPKTESKHIFLASIPDLSEE